MLRLFCPHCGSTRDEEEFTYGGPLERVRPAAPARLDDAEWADYLFTRDNTRGETLERWRHTFGCRRWFGVKRNTVSHEVTATAPLASFDRHHDVAPIDRGTHEAA